MADSPIRVLFLSERFAPAREFLEELLPADEVIACNPDAASEADVIVPTMSRVDAELMDRVRPRLIQQFGVGLDGVDLEAARTRGIKVGNVEALESGNADAVGEIAVLHLLALCRELPEAGVALAAEELGEPMGTSLADLHVVVLGVGTVGNAVVKRLRPFGPRLTGVGSRQRGEGAAELGLDAYAPSSELVQALTGANALVVCCALEDSTRGMVGAAELAALKPGAVLINVARGPIVQYQPLLEALRSGQLSGAGLDVFWEEPIDPADPLLAERVSATPHIGGVTSRSYRRMAEKVAEAIEGVRGEVVREVAKDS